MPAPVPEPQRRPWPVPWRSARLGWAVAAGALVAGVPLFLRMPPWCDITLYDVAVRNLLRGGVHYRDVFDTNPPGFVWLLTGIRTLFGESTEAVRVVDLAVVAATVFLLGCWVRSAGGSRAAVAWMAAGAALFYPFVSEFNHCQRDVWMLLPVTAVALMRLRRVGRNDPGGRFLFRAFLEGFLLGLAAWLKPHALVPAAAVWLVTLPRVSGGRWGAALLDFLGNLTGGLTALSLGVAWLVGSGAWPWFLEVFTFWSPGYLRMVVEQLPWRWRRQFEYFPPWSLFQPVALGLAAISLIPGRWWRTVGFNPVRVLGSSEPQLARTTLATLFLVWTGQALFLQRDLQYAHVPETLLMLAVFAACGYSAGFAGLVVGAVASLVVAAADHRPELRSAVDRFQIEWGVPGQVFIRHPLTDPGRMAWWPACWRTDLSPQEYRERRNAVAFQVNYFAGIDWVQLGEVADFLRSQTPPPRDGELLAWHDTPHALYLMLDVRPGFRFMHVSTVIGIGEPQYERLRDELHAATDGPNARLRWVVADLERVFNTFVPEQTEAMNEPGPSANDLLPPAMKVWFPKVASQFPFDQPTAFRSAAGQGRYVVLRLTHAVTPECRIPLGLGMDLPDE